MNGNLLTISQLSRGEIEEVLDVTDTMVEVSSRRIPKVPALRGRTVVSMFYEDSTRTRLSFESAAKRLSADVMSFSVASSSTRKGESLRDTVATLEAMGVDAFVVRHRSSGVPAMVARWSTAAVVNAGDGWHAHPTQALLDAYTIRSHFGSAEGLRVGIIGDILHSRVARSLMVVLERLGAEVTLVAPPTLLPPSTDAWRAGVSHDLDSVIGGFDVVYALRMQRERMTEAHLPSLREYTECYGLTPRRAAELSERAVIMHPGPMNRGVEISEALADSPRSLVTDQVANGVAVRMAVLYLLLGPGREALGEELSGAREST